MDSEIHSLVASTMLAAANSDGGIGLDETGLMVGLLRKRFDLAHNDALNLVTRASDELANPDAMDRLWAGINQKLDVQQKTELVAVVLGVISEDGAKDPAEMTFLAELIDRLQVPDDAFEKALDQYFRKRKNRA